MSDNEMSHVISQAISLQILIFLKLSFPDMLDNEMLLVISQAHMLANTLSQADNLQVLFSQKCHT